MTHLYSVHAPVAPSVDAILRVTLLGGFAVERHGCAVPNPVWQRRSARQLTKLLATEPGHALHREQVIDLLWPDTDLDSARNSLAKALHAARRVLEPGRAAREGSSVLRTRDELLVLDTECVSIDTEDFQQRAWAALRHPTVEGFEHALAAYGGTLLPEDRYEDWAAEQRQHLADLHLRVLHGLADLLERGGAHLQAVECLQRALQTDPTQEEAHRRLMHLYDSLGDLGAAVRQFDVCRSALQRELAVEPAGETIALHEAVEARHRARAAHPAAPRMRPFVGRTGELQALHGLVAHTAVARGGLVVVTGEAGVGKSRLVAEFAGEVTREGVLVLGATAPGNVALAPFAEALDAHAQDVPADARADLARRYPTLAWFTPALAAVTPPVAVAHRESAEMHLGAEIIRLLHELGGDGTVVVLLGDLDPGRGPEPALLATLAALAHERHWLLVGTMCGESLVTGGDAARVLAALACDGACVTLALPPLRADEAAALVRALDPGDVLGDARRAQICELTDGNPRFAEEYVRESLAHPTGHRRWNAPEGEALPVPRQVRTLLMRTLSRVGMTERRLLELIASADGEVAFDELRRAACDLGLVGSDAELLESLDVVLGAGILVDGQDGYTLRHAVMAAVLLEDLPRHRRTALRASLRDSVLDLRLAADVGPAAPTTNAAGGAPWPS